MGMWTGNAFFFSEKPRGDGGNVELFAERTGRVNALVVWCFPTGPESLGVMPAAFILARRGFMTPLSDALCEGSKNHELYSRGTGPAGAAGLLRNTKTFLRCQQTAGRECSLLSPV